MIAENEKREAMEELDNLVSRLLELRKQKKEVDSEKSARPEKPSYIFDLDEWENYLQTYSNYKAKDLLHQTQQATINSEIIKIEGKLKAALPAEVWVWTGSLWVGVTYGWKTAFAIEIKEWKKIDYNRLPNLVRSLKND